MHFMIYHSVVCNISKEQGSPIRFYKKYFLANYLFYLAIIAQLCPSTENHVSNIALLCPSTDNPMEMELNPKSIFIYSAQF